MYLPFINYSDNRPSFKIIDRLLILFLKDDYSLTFIQIIFRFIWMFDLNVWYLIIILITWNVLENFNILEKK